MSLRAFGSRAAALCWVAIAACGPSVAQPGPPAVVVAAPGAAPTGAALASASDAPSSEETGSADGASQPARPTASDRSSPQSLLDSYWAAAVTGDRKAMLAHFAPEERAREDGDPDAMIVELVRASSALEFLGVSSTRTSFRLVGGKAEQDACLTARYQIRGEPRAEPRLASFEMARHDDGWYLTQSYAGASRWPSADFPMPSPTLAMGSVVSQAGDQIVLELGPLSPRPPVGAQVDVYRTLERAMANVGPVGTRVGVAVTRVERLEGARVVLEVTGWPVRTKPDSRPWDHFVKGRVLVLEWASGPPATP